MAAEPEIRHTVGKRALFVFELRLGAQDHGVIPKLLDLAVDEVKYLAVFPVPLPFLFLFSPGA